MYADDITVTISKHSYPELVVSTHAETGGITGWFTANKLCLNGDKPIDFIFALGKHAYIHQQNSVKFLGVYLDRSLKFGLHVDYVCSRFSKNILLAA